MALSNSIQNESGVVATYFNIQKMALSPRDKLLDLTINGFLDQQMREDGKRPVFFWDKRLTYEDIGATGDVTQTQIYTFLKTIEPFINSGDI